MSKKIVIETDSFNSVASEIESSINNISIAADHKKVTGNMPVLNQYISLYESLIIAIREFKEVNSADMRKSKSAVNKIHHVDSELIK